MNSWNILLDDTRRIIEIRKISRNKKKWSILGLPFMYEVANTRMDHVTYRATGTKIAAYRSYFTLKKISKLGVLNQGIENAKALSSTQRTEMARGRLKIKAVRTPLTVRDRRVARTFSLGSKERRYGRAKTNKIIIMREVTRVV